MKDHNQNGFGYLGILLLVVVVAAIGFTGWYVRHAHHPTVKQLDNKLSSATASLSPVKEVKDFTDCSKQAGSVVTATTCTAVSNLSFTATQPGSSANTSPATPTTQPGQPTINFVDTSRWVTRTAKDNSYDLKLDPSATYGYCKGDQSIMLLGMVYLNLKDGVYDCSSITDAITGRNPYLTRIAVGVEASKPTIPDNVNSSDYKLADGTAVTRNSYSTTESGTAYNNTVYVAKKNSKYYVAQYRVESKVFYSYEIPFDTVILKTWQIK